MNIKNLMICFGVLVFILYGNGAHAEALLFKAGDKASYCIHQTLNSESKMFEEVVYTEAEATVALDIKILNMNQQNGSYPFDVEIIVRSFSISEVQQNGQDSKITEYDSSKHLVKLKNDILVQHLNKLIDHPLNFRIEGNFQVKETTGYLAQIYDGDDFSPPQGLLGATPWFFELFLTQLFHLSGENILLANSYPASCYQFLNWEDEALDEKASNITQSSHYFVKNLNPKKIKASWEGSAQVMNELDQSNGSILVKGNVTWSIAYPLIQKRDLKVKIEQEGMLMGVFPVYVKISAKQVWKPID